MGLSDVLRSLNAEEVAGLLNMSEAERARTQRIIVNSEKALTLVNKINRMALDGKVPKTSEEMDGFLKELFEDNNLNDLASIAKDIGVTVSALKHLHSVIEIYVLSRLAEGKLS